MQVMLPGVRDRFLIFALLAAGVCLASVGAARAAQPEETTKSPAPLTSLAWKDVRGRAYDLPSLKESKAVVFLFSSTQCPLSNIYTPRMIELATDFAPKGVQFFLVNSNREDSREAVQKYAADRKFPFPAIKDNGTELADRLGARVTPEAIILDKTGAVCYRGRLDDNPDRAKVIRSDARAALSELLAGQPIKFPRTLAAGCAIFREPAAAKAVPAARAAVTYTRDIAPILNQNCVTCHRAGEVAPFALETYPQARTWAVPIRDYTARRLMPPWKAVPGFGDFHDTRALTDAQIAALATWADSGMPQGAPKDLPPAPRFPDPTEWSLGRPDLIVQPVRPYHLEAEGKDVYRNFVLPVDFTEDRYVSAMEFKPGNRAVVHHIVTYIDRTGESAKLDGKETEPGYTVPGVGIGVLKAEWGEVWVPGRTPRFLPPGVAVKIPKGAKLVMQVHYHKNGAVQTDRSQMALYFAKGDIHQVVQVAPLGNYMFLLRPGDSHQEVHAKLTLPVAVHVRTMFPHMHLLGKEMKVTATLPDGTKKPLIYVNDWDFNWQETYEYKEPVALPAGTVVELDAVYDNSEENPHQLLHPPRTVRFGEQTTDEMCFAFVGFTVDDQNLDIHLTPTTTPGI
jgi:thiol-disulfide isomerase/thioredoxin/mono/diheme cytochrome c family protein